MPTSSSTKRGSDLLLTPEAVAALEAGLETVLALAGPDAFFQIYAVLHVEHGVLAQVTVAPAPGLSYRLSSSKRVRHG